MLRFAIKTTVTYFHFFEKRGWLMRYFLFLFIFLINSCTYTIVRVSKDVDITPPVFKDTPIKIIKRGGQELSSYKIIGTVYVEDVHDSDTDSVLLPMLIEAARHAGADAVLDVHASKFITSLIARDGTPRFPMKNYLSGLLATYADSKSSKDINNNYVDIFPIGNPGNIPFSNPIIKDRKLVRQLAQQFVEKNGYYARMVEDKFSFNKIRAIGKSSNLGNASSKYLLYLWPSYFQHFDEEGARLTSKKAVLKSILINKITGKTAWSSKEVPLEAFSRNSVEDNDSKYIIRKVKNLGFGNIDAFRAHHLYFIVEYTFSDLVPNYKELNIKPKADNFD